MNKTIRDILIFAAGFAGGAYFMAISNNSENELVCTVKTGPSTYKKNYIYLNDYTMYVVEDITGTTTDPYHYKMYFHTDVLPDVEVRS